MWALCEIDESSHWASDKSEYLQECVVPRRQCLLYLLWTKHFFLTPCITGQSGKWLKDSNISEISGSCWKIRMTQDFILVCGEEGGEPCEVSTTLDFPNVTFHNLLLSRYKWNLTVQSSWTASKPSSPASLGSNIETLPHRSCLLPLNIFWGDSLGLALEVYIGDYLWPQLIRSI